MINFKVIISRFVIIMSLSLQAVVVEAQDVIEMADLSVGKPNLFFSLDDVPALRQKSTSTSWLSEIRTAMLVKANEAVNNPNLTYDYSGEEIYIQEQILSTAMAGYISNNVNYINTAINILYNQVISSDPYVDFPKILNIGITAHTYAVGYDWLAPYMTEQQRTAILAEIESFGQCIYDRSLTESWGTDDMARLAHNWNGVIHGGLGLCAQVLNGHQIWLDLATAKARGYLQYCTDSNGGPWEGLGYIQYGLRDIVPMIAALERSGGANLFDDPAAIQMQYLPQYMTYTMYPWGAGYVPINQTGDPYCEQGGMFYIINKYNDQVGLWSWLRMMELDISAGSRTGYGLNNSLHPYILLWANPELESVTPQNGSYDSSRYFIKGDVVARTGWGANDALATFTAGTGIHSIWNHADIDSFTYYANNEAFAIEKGADYWTSAQHSIILMNGTAYSPDGGSKAVNGTLTRYEELDSATIISGDATLAYRQPFTRALRTVVFGKGYEDYLLIVDDIQKNTLLKPYIWQMYTAANNAVVVDGPTKTATITGGRTGAQCKVISLWPGTSVFRYDDANDLIAIEDTAVNPRFITLLISPKPGHSVPEIQTEGTPETVMTIRLLFADGSKDTITVLNEQVNFARTESVIPLDFYAVRSSSTIKTVSKLASDMSLITSGDAEGLGTMNDVAFNSKTGQLLVLRSGSTISRFTADLDWIDDTAGTGLLKIAADPNSGDIYIASNHPVTDATVMRYDKRMNLLGSGQAVNLGTVTALKVNKNGDVIVARGTYLSRFDQNLNLISNSASIGISITDIAVNDFGEIFVSLSNTGIAKYLHDLTYINTANASGAKYVVVNPLYDNIYVCRTSSVSRFDRNLNFLGNSNDFGPTTALAVNRNGEVLVGCRYQIAKLNADLSLVGYSSNYTYVTGIVPSRDPWLDPRCGDDSYPYPAADVAGIDCKVNFCDFAVIIQQWLMCGSNLAADLSGPDNIPDGCVNIDDFAILAQEWMMCGDPQDISCNLL